MALCPTPSQPRSPCSVALRTHGGLGPSHARQDRTAAACSLGPPGRPFGAASARAKRRRCLFATSALGAVLLARPCTNAAA